MWKSISYQKEVEVYGGRKALPVVLINGIYIGNHDDLQLLVDCDFLAPILRMEYLKSCLVCSVARRDEELYCGNCWKKFTFFEKPKQV